MWTKQGVDASRNNYRGPVWHTSSMCLKMKDASRGMWALSIRLYVLFTIPHKPNIKHGRKYPPSPAGHNFHKFTCCVLVWFASNPKLPHKKAFCSFMGPDYLSCTYLSPVLPVFTAWIVKLKNDICCHEYLRPCRQEYCLFLVEWE